MVDQYEGEVVEVFSGDDMIVMIDLGVEGLHKKQRVRLFGVDAPNAMNAGPGTDAGRVRSHVKNLCKNRKIHLEIVSRSIKSWVAKVSIQGGEVPYDLNADLVAQGYEYKREKQNAK